MASLAIFGVIKIRSMYEILYYHIIKERSCDGCSYQLLLGRFLLEPTMNHTKVCTSCQEEFPATSKYFHKKITGQYGVVAKCKQCMQIYNVEAYAKHRHKRVEAKRIYREKYHDRVLKSSKKSYKKHRKKRLLEKKIELQLYPEKMKQRRKQQYIKHREKRLLAVKEYAQNNKDKIQKYRAEYTINRYHNDPAFRIKMTLSRRMRGLIKKNGTRTIDLIGCSIDDLKKHLESKFRDGMNWGNYGRHGWHIDHIKPCASFDLTKKKQQKICFHYTNLQPLWEADNIRKGDKILDIV